MKTPNTPLKRGWTVHVDGETWESLKEIQAMSKVGPPSWTAIIAEAVKAFKKEAKK